MKTTKEIILALVNEVEEEEKKTVHVPHYYKRNGKMLRRSYDDHIYTDRYNELFFDDNSPLRAQKIFKCECCGEMVAYYDLEAWVCDFDKDEYICSICYEDEMGDDL